MRRSNRVLLNDHSCQLIPSLVSAVGNRSTAVILQEIHYWLTSNSSIGVMYSGKKWIYNTYKYISEKTGYSISAVKLSLKKLQNLGLVFVEKLNPVRSIRTNYYTINYDKLQHFIDHAHKQNISEDIKNSPDTGLENSNVKPHTHQSLNTPSSVNDYPMYNKEQIYLTDKNNKSEKFSKKIVVDEKSKNEKVSVQEDGKDSVEGSFSFRLETIPQQQKNQVEQVKNLKNNEKKEEKGENTQGKETEKKSSLKSPENLTNTTNTTTQDMLRIWNKTIEKAQTKMSKVLAPHLFSAYKNTFGEDMEKWSTYCKMIASSPYLMGEKFKLSLLWALKFSTIERILNYDLGVKELPQPEGNFEAKALAHIACVNEPPLCLTVRHKLLTLYGPKTYLSWIKDLTFSMDGNHVRFTAPGPFHESYIKRTFAEFLR